METTNKHSATIQRDPDAMTIDEIRMRMLVNSMKIQFERQRLQTSLIGSITPNGGSASSFMTRIDSWLKYATLAATAYRLTKKGISFFKSIKNKS